MSDERPTKNFFFQSQGEVFEGIGHQCVPANPEYWFIPSHGSMHETNLFTERWPAEEAAIAWIESQISTLNAKMRKLKA